ncbi:DDE superfamily endonuclease [Paraburkholderia sp. BL10I2N1]|nr:DDE superfamily endonuclease [Paraburkholderia sp. BL10I2N1]
MVHFFPLRSTLFSARTDWSVDRVKTSYTPPEKNVNFLKRRAPHVLITDKLKSYAVANKDLGLNVEHHQHKGLNNRTENSHQPKRVREDVMRRFKSVRRLQRFASVRDQVGNLFLRCRYNTNAQQKREMHTPAFEAWERVTRVSMPGRLAA